MNRNAQQTTKKYFLTIMTLSDSFSLAYRTVRSNKLRTGITVAIIAFGIMALIGIITAIDALNSSLRESFSTMGANGFTISYKERFRFNDNNRTEKVEKGKKQKNQISTSRYSCRKPNVSKELSIILRL